MDTLKDRLDVLNGDVLQIIKGEKKRLFEISDEDLEKYLEDRIALERIASLLTTAMYILDRRN